MAEAEAGGLRILGFEDNVGEVLAEMQRAVDAAPGYDLSADCEPSPGLLEKLAEVAAGTAREHDSDWHGVVGLRIRESWQSRRAGLVWTDDKLLQAERTEALVGRRLHLPALASAAEGDAGALEAAAEVLRGCVAEDRPVVVKPRHGANAAEVYLWPSPREAGEAAVLASLASCAKAWDKTWSRENWQLAQVPKGALVQPMYRSAASSVGERGGDGGGAAAGGGPAVGRGDRPLELRVLVVFGAVVGAVLTGLPFELWVSPGGAVRPWSPEELKDRGVPGSQKHAKRLAPAALQLLRDCLRESWSEMKEASEQLVRASGLDELRVDWLLGDPEWGPRVGELTYMGAGSSVQIPEVSRALARLYTSRHVSYHEERRRSGAAAEPRGAPEAC